MCVVLVQYADDGTFITEIDESELSIALLFHCRVLAEVLLTLNESVDHSELLPNQAQRCPIPNFT